MIPIDEIRTAISTGLNNYLQCPVIRTNQNQRKPQYPYITYTITTLMSENKGTYGVLSDNTHIQAFKQIWSLSALSDDYSECAALANKAHSWLESSGAVYLSDSSVIVESVGSITNRDTILTADYEYRYGFDFVLRVMDIIPPSEYEGDGIIQTVEFNKNS